MKLQIHLKSYVTRKASVTESTNMTAYISSIVVRKFLTFWQVLFPELPSTG